MQYGPPESYNINSPMLFEAAVLSSDQTFHDNRRYVSGRLAKFVSFGNNHP
jgi:hypothetical protein